MGNTADVGPEIGSCAATYEEVRSDMVFYNVGCAPRNPLEFLGTRRTSGWHVELPVGFADRHQIHNQGSMQKNIINTVRISGRKWGRH